MQDTEVTSPSCRQLTASWSDQPQSPTNHVYSSKSGGPFKPAVIHWSLLQHCCMHIAAAGKFEHIIWLNIVITYHLSAHDAPSRAGRLVRLGQACPRNLARRRCVRGNTGREESCQVRRSTWLAKKKGPSTKDWPVPKLLEAPSGASHGVLFKFAMRHLNIPDAAAVPPATPPASSKKYTAKKKHGSRSSANASHGFTEASISIHAKGPRSHINHQIQDPVLATLSNIQSSLNEMDTWIHHLESPSTCTPQNTSPQPGPLFESPATTAPGTPPIVITPHRSLGTAVPATPTGVPFIPPAAAVSP